MLSTAMFRNLSTDRRLTTIAGANSVGIGMGGDKAYRTWLAQQDAPEAVNPAVAAQAATIGRLGALFGSQKKSSGLRNAIRIKRPD